MRTLTVLTVGVSLVICLRATEVPVADRAAAWSSTWQAAQAAIEQQDFKEAIRLYSECVSLSTNSGERLLALSSYGIALSRAGRDVEAKPVLEQALAGQDRIPNSENRVIISGVLAAVNRSLGDYRAAEGVLRTGIGYGSGTQRERATMMLNLADLLREEVRNAEAFEVLNEASRLPGLSHETQTRLEIETGNLTRDMGLWDQSIAEWNKIGEQADREHSPRLEALYTGGLGEIWFDAGNPTRAEPLLRRSLQLLQEDPGASAAELATAWLTLANLYIMENKLALADEALDAAAGKDPANFALEHPQAGLMLEMKAQILSRRGETQAARENLERARLIMSDHFGEESLAVAGVFSELGDVETRGDRPAAALEEYKLAMQLSSKAGRDGARLQRSVATRYAAALKAAHKPGEARAVLAAATAQSFRQK